MSENEKVSDVKIYQPGEVICFAKGEVRCPNSGEFFESSTLPGNIYQCGPCGPYPEICKILARLEGAIVLKIEDGKRAHLLIETDCASEATHYESSGFLCARGHCSNSSLSGYKLWYKLMPLAPPQPTSAELAAAEREKALESYKQKVRCERMVPAFVDEGTFLAGYDAHAAGQKAGE